MSRVSLTQHAGHTHSGHAHAHPSPADLANVGGIFTLTILLNSVFVAIEFGYGFWAHSTALIADAGHNLSDVLALFLAWGAIILARRLPSPRYTYGLRSASILAALANAMLLLVACGAIAWEAIQRFSAPPAVASLTILTVAGLGIFVNGFSAWLLTKGRQDDVNIRGAYLHMLADAAVSLGVVIAGGVMWYTHAYWLDPVMSLVIVGVILLGTWRLLRESMQLALNAVPAHIDIAAVDTFLRSQEGVVAVHDLHIWGISTTENALTAHLIIPGAYPGDAYLSTLTQALKTRFSIHHTTLQIAQSAAHPRCALHHPASPKSEPKSEPKSGPNHDHDHDHDHDSDHDHHHDHA